MFGRRRRRDAKAIQSLEARLDEVESQASLVAAIGRMEQLLASALQRAQSAQAGTEQVVEHLWQKVIEREQDLTRAVDEVVRFCALLTERVEAEQAERRVLAEAVRSLTRQLPSSSSTPASASVVGGRMFATADDASPDTDDAFLDDDVVGVEDLSQRWTSA